MDNITMETRQTMKPKRFVQPKVLTIVLISVIGSTALLGCSQKNEDTETIASKQAALATQATDNQASRNNGAWGGVYMSRDELAASQANIVDVSSLTTIAKDPELTKWEAKFEGIDGFATNDGEKLYHDSCAACHMSKGEGAIGAGYYPPLANNSKMESKYYVIDILINGFRGMPSFHMMMNDEQMAAVTQYVHSELNDFEGMVTAADVAQLRHDNPPGYDPSE